MLIVVVDVVFLDPAANWLGPSTIPPLPPPGRATRLFVDGRTEGPNITTTSPLLSPQHELCLSVDICVLRLGSWSTPPWSGLWLPIGAANHSQAATPSHDLFDVYPPGDPVNKRRRAAATHHQHHPPGIATAQGSPVAPAMTAAH